MSAREAYKQQAAVSALTPCEKDTMIKQNKTKQMCASQRNLTGFKVCIMPFLLLGIRLKIKEIIDMAMFKMRQSMEINVDITQRLSVACKNIEEDIIRFKKIGSKRKYVLTEQ